MFSIEDRVTELAELGLKKKGLSSNDIGMLKDGITDILYSLNGQPYTKETEDIIRMKFEDMINMYARSPYSSTIRIPEKLAEDKSKVEVPDYAIDPLELLGEEDDKEGRIYTGTEDCWWSRAPQRLLPDTAYWFIDKPEQKPSLSSWVYGSGKSWNFTNWSD